jgi:hypothetical protein
LNGPLAHSAAPQPEQKRAPEYRAKLEAVLKFTKPQFNESMRSGDANM